MAAAWRVDGALAGDLFTHTAVSATSAAACLPGRVSSGLGFGSFAVQAEASAHTDAAPIGRKTRMIPAERLISRVRQARPWSLFPVSASPRRARSPAR